MIGTSRTEGEPVKGFEYFAPGTLDEAIALFTERGEGGRAVAGGTDIVVQMKESATRFPYPSYIVDLTRVSELKGVDFNENEGLRVGAGATMTDIAKSGAVRDRYPALAEGAGVVGSLQTMNMATIGGNVCNAAPSADTAPPLLVYEAEAVIVGPKGRRSVPIEEFFTGPGTTVLGADELLAELRLTVPPKGTGGSYQRHTPRKQMDIAVVGVAAALTLDGGNIARARISLGAVAPTPVRRRSRRASAVR
jgi:CO/xanthine dehydrogenase FAD-binding subunit